MSVVVVVESPTKAKTIRDFLPKGYEVIASMGHIRDLPQSASEIPEKVKKEKWAQLGVNVEKDFEPLYVVPKDKKKIIKEIKDLLAKADELILATDEDREGESISWHLLEELKPKVPVKRMVFHEITKEAITEALANCREIKISLVRAQETRRILDRLVGYTLSPLLWKKVAAGLSAGRVQSAAVRVLVQKERERRAFQKASYWDLVAQLEKDGTRFDAKLNALEGQKIAQGADFDENTGKLKKGKKVRLLDEKAARTLENELVGQAFKVLSLEEKPSASRPAPPFITSTLQQEANRKLRLSPRQAMQVAQALYERGFITYMRTDSVNLSDQAIDASRKCVTKLYGKDYLPEKPRLYKTKSKGAQEAHEAIRPAGSTFIEPAKSGLKGMELALYDLIWKRTVASQMKDAQQVHLTALFEAGAAQFRSSGKRIEFPGFFRAYVEGSDDPNQALEDKEVVLPAMKAGEMIDQKSVEAKDHETKPPARFTEASLVKKLEAEGIGRPSTYATVIDTIQNRGYVEVVNHTLVPTFTAFAVVGLLEAHFAELVDLDFTAKMEQVLDEVALGEKDWLPYMKEFYSGKDGLGEKTARKTDEIGPGEFRSIQFDDLTAKVCIGRFGPYLEIGEGEEHQTASIPKDITPAELSQEQVDLILMQQQKGHEELGIHPDTGQPVFLFNGAYGPYVQLGEAEEGKAKPKRVTLPKGLKEEEVDMEAALKLLSLPRHLGDHPETGAPVRAGISRFGSYVVHEDPKGGKDYRTLPKEMSILDVEMAQAMELLSQEKRGRRKKSEALREMGEHPVDGKPVAIFNGPYGPYVKHEKTNASIPKDESVDDLSMERAVELLDARAKVKPKARGRRRS
ncbi:MAG: type I DNA topoisomerase [bacterium]|nr:type I DNA topoisomerase [bacterium]